jgi:serine/threonine protein kinase
MLQKALKPGTLIGQDFEIQQRLAQGGMGTVYIALQHSTGKHRALKVMHAQYEEDEQARKRFILEARVGASIDSDHIVEMVGAGVDPETGTPWIAMELLKGDDLKAVINTRTRLPPEEVIEVFRQVCHALGKAHVMGLVHRDLKPENIFMATPRREGIPFTVKLLDFGIAKLVKETTGNNTHTQAVGSPRWMAPEQADRGTAPICAATDVWALGLLAFTLLTGEIYWKTAHHESPSMVSQMCEVLMDPLDTASVRAAEFGVASYIPEGFDGWFSQCVHRDVTQRYQDATAALVGLEAVLGDGVTGQKHGRVATRAGLRVPTGGYTLTGSHKQLKEPSFSLDATQSPQSPDVSARRPVHVPAPQKRRLVPTLMAIVGPLAIVIAVVLGLHRTQTQNPTQDAAAMAVPPPDVAEVIAPVDIVQVVSVQDVWTPPPPSMDVAYVAPHVTATVRDAAAHSHTRVNTEPDVVVQAVDTTGEYTRDVMALLHERQRDFTRCYEELGAPEVGTSMQVSLHFSIRANGEPQGVGTGGNDRVGSCVADIVRAMRFPTPVGVTSTIYHVFRFRSSQGE